MKNKILYIVFFMLCFSSMARATAEDIVTAMNSNGESVSVWLAYDPVANEYTVNASILSNGGILSTAQVIATPAEMPSQPAVAINSSGNIAVIWAAYDPIDFTNALYMNTYDSTTSSWQTTSTLISSTSEEVQSYEVYSVKLSDDNFLVVSWSSYSELLGNNVVDIIWGVFGAAFTGGVTYT